MPSSTTLLSLAAAVSTATAAFQGFNYGATFTNGALKQQSDFEADFKRAASLPGTNGAFNSARLYTMVQGNTGNQPISAIPAAINTRTSLLFGLWASGDGFDNEIAGLKNTISQYCGKLDGLVAGISVGSEDLYRSSPIGIKNKSGVGSDAKTLVNRINQVRNTIKGSCLADVPIGHVDTWTAFVEPSSASVIEACDWLGMDAYPYFEDTKPNSIGDGASVFQAAIDNTAGVANGKPIWITETGWPVSGSTSNLAVPSKANARKYWEDVGCSHFGKTNTWWFTLQDADPTTPNPSFGIVGANVNSSPLYDLSCADIKPVTSSKSGGSGSGSGSKTTSSAADSSSSTTAQAETTATITSSAAETTTAADGSSSSVVNTPVTTITSVVASSSSSDSGSGSGSDSGSPTTGPSGTATPSVPAGSERQYNSYSAAVIALILAVAAL